MDRLLGRFDQAKSLSRTQARIWVRLGCNKNSRRFPRAPAVAIGAMDLLLVTSEKPRGESTSWIQLNAPTAFRLVAVSMIVNFADRATALKPELRRGVT
jgi:hypothetical protein